jgi:thiamine-monophosphate kinase
MEFDLIARIRSRATTRDDVVLGIGDDAALLRVPDGHELAVSTDTLNAGVHFPADTAVADLGWKALAVNLSDLAAMGATPAWCTLSLSLPQADARWLDAFLDGFLSLAQQHRVALVGGDTTRGPLSIGVTVHGLVPAGQALRRDRARAGDDVWITGTPGDAAAALARLGLVHGVDPAALSDLDTAQQAALRERLDRPTPRVATGLALRGLAHAGIDVSDGLCADLGHVLRASGVGARIELAQLPASEALRAACPDASTRWTLQLAGGDDYELCFTAPPSARAAVERALQNDAAGGARIGTIEAGTQLLLCAPDGSAWPLPRAGWQHFEMEPG